MGVAHGHLIFCLKNATFGQMCVEDDHIISVSFGVIHTHHGEQNCFHLEAHGLLKLPCLAVGSGEENH